MTELATTKADAATLAAVTDEQIAAMTDADFAAFMGKLLGVTAELIALAGRAYRARLASGKDMPPLVGVWKTYLPLIASGAVLPATVATLIGKPSVLRAVARLPIEDQRKLIDGGAINVCQRVGVNDVSFSPMKVSELTPAHVKLVFDDRSIRSEAGQRAILTAPALAAKVSKVPPARVGLIHVDRKTQTIRIGKGREFVTAEEMMRVIRENGWDNFGQ